MLPVTTDRSARWWGDPFLVASRNLDSIFNPQAWTQGGNYPVDIHEDENNLYVEAEMPGFKKDQIDITLENGVLTITGHRGQEKDDGDNHLHERRWTRYARRFALPTTVNESKVAAKLEDGVLHLTLPKREEAKPRRIELK